MYTTYTEIFLEVLVFKTNIASNSHVEKIRPVLSTLKEIKKWNIDRDDIDKVLRIESLHLAQETVIHLLHQAGFECEELPD